MTILWYTLVNLFRYRQHNYKIIIIYFIFKYNNVLAICFLFWHEYNPNQEISMFKCTAALHGWRKIVVVRWPGWCTPAQSCSSRSAQTRIYRECRSHTAGAGGRCGREPAAGWSCSRSSRTAVRTAPWPPRHAPLLTQTRQGQVTGFNSNIQLTSHWPTLGSSSKFAI